MAVYDDFAKLDIRAAAIHKVDAFLKASKLIYKVNTL